MGGGDIATVVRVAAVGCPELCPLPSFFSLIHCNEICSWRFLN